MNKRIRRIDDEEVLDVCAFGDFAAESQGPGIDGQHRRRRQRHQWCLKPRGDNLAFGSRDSGGPIGRAGRSRCVCQRHGEDGSNQLRGTFYSDYEGKNSQSANPTDALRDRGIVAGDKFHLWNDLNFQLDGAFQTSTLKVPKQGRNTMPIHYFSRIVDGVRSGTTRRQLLQGGGLLAAAGWLLPSQSFGQTGTQQGGTVTSIYDSIGVIPIVNARGAVTIVGATRTLPEVKRAMEEAARHHVHLDELMDGVGRRLAELTGAEWGIVTSGASAALTVATAGCIAGGDPDKLAQLPDLRGLKDEVIMPRYSRTAYDHAARVTGAKIIEVENRKEFEAALGSRTAMIMILGRGLSQGGPLPVGEIVSLAKPRGIPVLVDAATDGIVVPNPYLSDGADLVVYSGGKRLRGPQCAGLLIGRKDLVQSAWINSAPHHGFGRGFKVGREEIMGMLVAVEMWMKRDSAEEWRTWMSWLGHVARRLEQIPGVTTDIAQTQAQGFSTPNRTPSLRVAWDTGRIPLNGDDVENLLWDGTPRIAVGGAGSFLPFPPNFKPTIQIVPTSLEAGEERLIADRVFSVLSNPPPKPPRTEAPAFDVNGQWEVDLKFVSGNATQSFALEQKGSDLVGTHYGSFARRDLNGTLHGRDILIRSSYTEQGVRLNFTFTGTVHGDTMKGHVRLGEYGSAEWEAKRRTYQLRGSPA